jgi:hypothetical protein
MGAMALDWKTAAPAVPAIRAAPAKAVQPLVAAQVPARALPAIVVPAVVAIIVGRIVLSFFDPHQELQWRKRASGMIANARLRAVCDGQKHNRHDCNTG